VVEVGSSVVSLRSSLDEFAETYRKDIAVLAQTHRKDIGDITKRLDRVEQAVAAREVTSSIRTSVRRSKARRHRPAPVVRSTGDMAPFQPMPHPLFPGPVVSSH
jgi:folylpolyglutamate synthase/dihydropteroate synthase